MSISLRLSDEDSKLFRKYAEMNGISVSELVRQSVLERIYDEHDILAYEEALAAFHKNPETFTLEEVEEELGLR